MANIEKHLEREESRGGKKSMEGWMKIVLSLAGLGCIGVIAFGIATFQTAKENEVKDAAVSTGPVIVQVQDKVAQTEVEEQVDKVIEEVEVEENQLQKEAENQFHELILSADVKEQFISEYVALAEQGVNSSEIVKMLSEKYTEQVEETVGVNGISEDAELEDEYDRAYQAQLDAEAAAQAEQVVESTEQKANSDDFQVLYMDTEEMYATKAVNLRVGPGTAYDKIRSLVINEEVIVIGLVPTDSGNWYQIGTEDREVVGYVSATYISDEQVAVESEQTEVKEPAQSENNQSSESSSSLEDVPDIFSGGSWTGGIDGSDFGTGGSGNGAGILVY